MTVVHSQRTRMASQFALPFSRSYSKYLLSIILNHSIQEFFQKESERYLNMVLITGNLNSRYEIALEAIEVRIILLSDIRNSEGFISYVNLLYV